MISGCLTYFQSNAVKHKLRDCVSLVVESSASSMPQSPLKMVHGFLEKCVASFIFLFLADRN